MTTEPRGGAEAGPGSLLPGWADEVRSAFRSGSISQFVVHGNVRDLVELPGRDGSRASHVSIRRFLTEAMFEPFDVVLHYDRGRGIRVRKGGKHFQRFLEAYDAFRGTDWAKLPAEAVADGALDLSGTLPRDAARALELLDRFLRGSQVLTRIEGGRRIPAPLSVAVLVDYAEFVAPRGEALHLSGERSQILIQLLDWASDPSLTGAFVTSVLVAESLADLHPSIVESPYNLKVRIPFPTAGELERYLDDLTAGETDFEELCDFDRRELAQRLVGLSRVDVRTLVLRALRNRKRLDHRFVTALRKELIEKQAAGLVEFVESKRTLDDVAGHGEAKAWLRQDAELLRRGRVRSLPMGYLLAGRIGTGKTFLVECWAGEVGIPVVELKNFRSKWIGATEGNLEKIFTILHALGQVIVFVDEADQATGRRGQSEGDSGLSGRIYGMLAREMSDTRNRGRIVWVFATSRPDLVEVDLKRQGRLDVHIPLFPPQDRDSRHELFAAMARKVGLALDPEDLPQLPDDHQIGGNEMEGILVRALRRHETGGDERPPLPEVIAEVIEDFRPSAHVDRLELMDLLAVKECTDRRFLPDRYRDLDLGTVNRRIDELQRRVG